MHSGTFPARIRLFCVAFFMMAVFAFAPTRAAYAGAADNVWGYFWSSTGGWISLNCTDLGSCATVDYGVRLEDVSGSPGTADLKGYAWSETFGWICFGVTCTGTTPEGGLPYAQFRSMSGGKADQFWGWAQVVSLGNGGWISLNCDKDVGADSCVASNHYVGFNNSTGVFNPGGATDHWAWSGNDEGTGLGWISTDNANTSWIFSSLGKVIRPAGVYEPESLGGVCVTDANCSAPQLKCDTGIGRCVLPGTHLKQLTVSFQQFYATSGNLLECEIEMPNLSRRLLSKSLTYAAPGRIVNGSESLSYTVQAADDITVNSLWYLTDCRIAGPALVTPCANDAACGANKICDETISKCRTVTASMTGKKPIFSHANVWTGLGASEDQYSAVKCNAGFPGVYFKNAAQCDFTADASFALSMRRGIPVEGNCTDGIDNDGNGQIDCADRYCKGVSYQCAGATLPRTSCTWGQSGDGVGDCSDPAYVSGNLCCTRQPMSQGASLSQIVDGLECTPGDAKDGIFDCSCINQPAYDASPSDDCFSPGYQSGDLCCSAAGNVTKQ